MGGRKEKRYWLDHVVAVGLVGAGYRFGGVLLNVSPTGMLVRCSVIVELGTMMRAAIEMGPDTIRTLVIARRQLPETGIAFEFQNMTPRDRQKLRLLIVRLSKPLSPADTKP